MIVKRINVLGVGVSVLNLPLAVNIIAEALKKGIKGYICVTSVHGIIEAQYDSVFKRILNNSLLTTPDGMPLVWSGKLAGQKEIQRVYGPELMLKILERSIEEGWTHFFYGGIPGVAEQLKERMEKRFPGLKVVGTFTPPFRPLSQEEETLLIWQVEQSCPDLFWVGLSTPKQERFMAAYLDKLNTKIMIGVGAAFDFLTGRIPQAPSWMQRIGLEWLFRLCMEPRRLWRRYLKNNPLFLWLMFCQLTGLKKFPLETHSTQPQGKI